MWVADGQRSAAGKVRCIDTGGKNHAHTGVRVYVARVISRAEAQSFNRVAEDYDRLGDLDRRRWIEQWLASVLPDCGQRALDVGCGPGRQAVTLAGRFGQVGAIDLSGAMIELARARRARPNISYRQADLHELDSAGGY